ncbi:hypothetical protein [Qipengyuania aquimaris]|uniref:hypothetical protein n=1 Tax=Qipengyuania aquimaris TaxID=255984 RepID=UPI001CD63A05|nr:hypothetical protein [Qipengyuania aquimaris]MCA0903897.1 hypothetical protein [Qipengyuania aquimaris]
MNAIKKISVGGAELNKQLRELTKDELAMVAGGTGTIVVTGDRWEWDYWDYNDYYSDPNYEDVYSGGGGGGGDAEPDPEPEAMDEALKTALEGELAKLEQNLKDMIDKVGDFDIKVGDFTIKASALLDGLGKLGGIFDLYEAGQITNDILNGDASVGQVVGFLGALALGAGMATAGAGPLAIFIATSAAGLLIPGAVNSAVELLNAGFEAAFDIAVDSLGSVPSDPSWPDSISEYHFILHLLGQPHDHSGDPYGDPYYGGGGFNDNPHYQIP